MLWIALASIAAAGPSAPPLLQRITPDDYPTWALEADASAAAVVHVTIGPDGRVLDCTQTEATGNSRLAKDICPITRRKRFEPAALRNGAKVHAFLDELIQLFLPSTKEGLRIAGLSRSPDAELTVKGLPGSDIADVRILLAYDSAGSITDCGAAVREKQLKLAEVACSQRAMFDHAAKLDPAGKPIPYVTMRSVRFRPAPPAE